MNNIAVGSLKTSEILPPPKNEAPSLPNRDGEIPPSTAEDSSEAIINEWQDLEEHLGSFVRYRKAHRQGFAAVLPIYRKLAHHLSHGNVGFRLEKIVLEFLQKVGKQKKYQLDYPFSIKELTNQEVDRVYRLLFVQHTHQLLPCSEVCETDRQKVLDSLASKRLLQN